MQLLPEQQCERVERVDLFVQRGLLRYRQRLWPDLQQYVQPPDFRGACNNRAPRLRHA